MAETALHEVHNSRFVPHSLEKGLNTALSRGPGYEPTPMGTAYARSGVRGYYIDFSSKTRSRIASDTNRILPAPLAQLALGWWERRLQGEANATEQFLHVCKLLADRGQLTDDELRWPITVPGAKYRLPPGACSALTQGQAASVFVRAFQVTGDELYATTARRAAAPLISNRRSELVTLTRAGPVLEEAPSVPASHILNGWISGLWGIWDVALALDDRPARDEFAAGAESLLSHLPAYDTGWWSRYSLYPHTLEDLAKPIYHRYHVDQLKVMSDLTGRSEFQETAARWSEYDTRSNLVLALIQKSLFALADGRRRRRWLAAWLKDGALAAAR